MIVLKVCYWRRVIILCLPIQRRLYFVIENIVIVLNKHACNFAGMIFDIELTNVGHERILNLGFVFLTLLDA